MNKYYYRIENVPNSFNNVFYYDFLDNSIICASEIVFYLKDKDPYQYKTYCRVITYYNDSFIDFDTEDEAINMIRNFLEINNYKPVPQKLKNLV